MIIPLHSTEKHKSLFGLPFLEEWSLLLSESLSFSELKLRRATFEVMDELGTYEALGCSETVLYQPSRSVSLSYYKLLMSPYRSGIDF